MTYKGVELRCITGNILESKCEGICVSCDAHYGLSSAVGNAVHKAGGNIFTKNWEKAKAKAKGGPIAVEAAGNLKCQLVILVPIRGSDRNMMQLIYGQLFHKAIEVQLKSVAVPALGTGSYGLSSRQASIDMRDALTSIPDFGSLKTIDFLDLNAHAVREFQASIQELTDPSRKRRTQEAATDAGASKARKGEEHYSRVEPKKLAEERKASKSDSPDEEEELACSICLTDMDGKPIVVRLNVCGHLFHEDCIKMAFKVKSQCPLCQRWYAPAIGKGDVGRLYFLPISQPEGSRMTVRVVQGTIAGHPDAKSIHEINYSIPSGIQTAEHLRPGQPFHGTHRVAYLPNNPEGTAVLKLLQLAFERRLIFTVGDSVTSGAQNVAIWNGIHHKTSLSGGAQSYGYPDPTYLTRVQEELASLGIIRELLD